MSKRSLGYLQTRLPRLAAFCVSGLCGLVACGGRAMTDSADSAGAAGASGSGGRIGHSEGNTAGAATSGAGSGGVGTSSDGAAGAPDACANVTCPSPWCPVGTTPVLQKGACCVSCQTMCAEACTTCDAGWHPVMHPNECCPTCEPDTPPALSCESGKMTYTALRAQMVDKYSRGCSVDQDCVASALGNRCETECAYYAIVATQADDLNRNLVNEANIQCLNCPWPMTEPCGPRESALCVDSVCRLP